MKFNVIYAIGNKSHITGNEEIHHAVVTKEELKEMENRHDIILANTWRYVEGEDISDHFA